ncbi:glycosyltransferase [Flavobacterium rakeshii]|uniref:Glycosyltransferase n=1 Tax=Flavobacterium rakeshii TaxID=1038845 RepID=A0A6N8HDR1_9FLAO|nr:glycosyltransferase family A protein [Flavobacterium rakeshii]MUV03626.1 glycosyltransferase [Flavobacterium rakeshii]
MISIITTVKNGSKYILETLESIKNQTFKDFEHIIVDDGSTDNTVQILNKFQFDNPNYKLLLFQPGSLGRGKALNFAIGKAKFEWVAIIDADDIWHPEKLKAQVNILKVHPEITVLATKTKLFSKSFEFDDFKVITFYLIKPKKMLYKSIISHSSVIIKKQDAVYDEKRVSQFDADLWYRLAFNSDKTLALIEQELNFHRIHETQSFESSKGQLYQINAIKLNVKYCIKTFTIFPLIIYAVKYFYRSLIPRNIRFKRVK